MTRPPAVESSRTSFDPQTLAKLKGLHLRARHIVEGYVAGLHRSPYHGFSIEFAEHREYSPGDDLRYVDWKVFGRTDKHYLKQYEDETNLLCYLVLDTSESMQYRGPNSALSKFEYAQCLASALAWLVLHQQDAVGLVTYDNQVRQFIRPSSNATHLQNLLQVMENTQPAAKTNSGPIFHELADRLKRRGLVIVLSDFFDDVGPSLAGLKHLRHRRHDVVLFHVLDQAEIEFPFQSPTEFKGLEEFPHVVADPQMLRAAYLKEFQAYERSLLTGCRAQGIDVRRMRTDQPIDVALTSFLAERRIRVA